MNEIPTSNEEPEETDDRYRRLSARGSSVPSEAVRRAVLRHAAELAAQPRAAERSSSAAKRTRRRVAAYGGLAAAATLAGLLTVPRFWMPPAAPVARLPAAAPAPKATASSSTALPPAAQVDAPRADEKPVLAQDSLAERRTSAAQPPPLASSAAASPRAFSSPRAESLVNPQAALREAARRGDVPAIRRLLAEKLDVDARDAGGRTALMLAVLQARRQAVDALLAAGANPNAADASGTTPLQAALAGAHPAIVEALERSGAR